MNDTATALRIAVPGNSGPSEIRTKMPTAIDIRDLDFYYGKSHALKDVSMAVPANGVTAIIGPSGCGKSTLIRCLNRMHEVIPKARAEGKVTLDTVDIYARDIDATSVRRMSRA